jgi:hypothetical protein
VHPGFSSQDRAAPAKFPFDLFDQYAATLSINLPHLPDMPREMSFPNEFCEHGLIGRRGAQIHRLTDRGETLNEIGRNHDVSDTQRWKQRLFDDNKAVMVNWSCETIQDRLLRLTNSPIIYIKSTEAEYAGWPGSIGGIGFGAGDWH